MPAIEQTAADRFATAASFAVVSHIVVLASTECMFQYLNWVYSLCLFELLLLVWYFDLWNSLRSMFVALPVYLTEVAVAKSSATT